MPPPEPPAPPNEFSDSDQAWFDRLGPAPRPPPRTPAEREGDLLKEAMRIADEQLLAQRPDLQAALGDEAAERRRLRLQARLDAAGLLMPTPPAAAAPTQPARGRQGWWPRFVEGLRDALTGPRWPAAAGLALVLALGTVVVQVYRADHVYDEPTGLKGADDVRQVTSARPREAAEAFAAELRSAGLQPGLFQRGKTFIVDIDVERERYAAATPAFARIGLEPRLGFTRIEFGPPQAR